VAVAVATTTVVTVALVVAVVVLVVSGIINMALAVLDLQQELVVLDHKVAMDLVDTQEQVAVAVPHLELLVTLV
jgi:cell division protein FtsL